MRTALGIAVFTSMSAALLAAGCIPFDKAPQHVGEIICIRGRVVKVSATPGGTHYLNFCENYLACPFTVVVLAKHIEEIGDVRSLENREIEIDGLVKLYNGHPEILLAKAGQLHGEAASRIPPLPKTFDVSEHGRFSAGSTYMKKPKRTKRSFSNAKEEDPFADPTLPN